MKGEFRKGDVIVRIDGKMTYVVADAHTDRYSLLYLLGNNVTYNILYKDFIDKQFVKVDKCNPEDFAGVVDKIDDILYNLGKGENQWLTTLN